MKEETRALIFLLVYNTETTNFLHTGWPCTHVAKTQEKYKIYPKRPVGNKTKIGGLWCAIYRHSLSLRDTTSNGLTSNILILRALQNAVSFSSRALTYLDSYSNSTKITNWNVKYLISIEFFQTILAELVMIFMQITVQWSWYVGPRPNFEV